VSDLVDFVLEAHGGTARWERATQLSATMRIHGEFWAFKGQPDLLSIETVAADIHQQRIRMTPFADGNSVEFDSASDQVTITDDGGAVSDRLGLSTPASTATSTGCWSPLAGGLLHYQ
jgi:hypothetical protein